MEDDEVEIPEADIEGPDDLDDEVEIDDTGDEELEPDGGEDLADDDGQDEVDEPRRPSRREARIQTLAEETRAARERADRLEAEIHEIRQREYSRSRSEETEAQRAERLALMTPEERSEYRLAEAMELNRRQLAEMQFRMEDQSDKRTFDAQATIDPLYAKWAPTVEAELQKLRMQGQNIDRERLFQYLVGKSVLEARRSKSGAARKGQESIRRQQAPAGRSRADTPAQRRQVADSPAKRLEGVQI